MASSDRVLRRRRPITPYLDKLPYDCVHEIQASLDLPSINNLRLTSRALRGSCSGGQFEACLRQQATDLSESSLRSLSDLSSHHELGPAVRELKICVPLYDESLSNLTLKRTCDPKPVIKQIEWLQGQRKKQAELLDSFVFDHLASAFASLPRLEKVSLDIEIVRLKDPNPSLPRGHSRSYAGWPRVWGSKKARGEAPRPDPTPEELHPRASQLYRLLISAIVKSGTSLTSLELFTDSSKCGVPLNDLQINTWHNEAEDLGVVTDSIKHLGLKIWTAIDSESFDFQPQGGPVKGSGTRVTRSQTGKVTKPYKENFQGLMDLLGHLRGLQSLHLGLFSTSLHDRVPKSEIFQAIVQHAQFPSLQHCELGGIYASETHLLQFFENHHHIQELIMDKIDLTSGSWQPIFSHLSNNMPVLKRLKLSLLLTQHGVENLIPIWEDSEIHSYVRQFDERDLAEGLVFHDDCLVWHRSILRISRRAGPIYGHD